MLHAYNANFAVANDGQKTNKNKAKIEKIERINYDTAIAPRFKLSKNDVYKYKLALKYLKKGDVYAYRRVISKIKNKSLFPYLQYVKFFSSWYTTSYGEASRWMKKYNDFAVAGDVYRLIKAKYRSKIRNVKKAGNIEIPSFLRKTGYKKKNIPQRNWREKKVWNYVKRNAKKNRITAAYRHLLKNKNRIRKYYFNESLVRILKGYYFLNLDRNIVKITKYYTNSKQKDNWEIMWWSALANFRIGRYKTAFKLFNNISKITNDIPYIQTASYFWSGYSLKKINNKNARKYFAIASKKPVGFYSILASAFNGKNYKIRNIKYVISKKTIRIFSTISAYRRAYNLTQIGLHKFADIEMKRIFFKIKPSYYNKLTTISYILKLRNTQVSSTHANHDISDYYKFPKLNLKTNHINSELTHAIIKQESAFKSYVKSHANAIGLMQILPSTAVFISNKLKILPSRYNRNMKKHLKYPKINIKIGQKYMKYLIDLQKNNLVKAIASYNAGHGNIKKWSKNMRYNRDPLIFIESIPSRENRMYVEKVLGNYWAYRLLSGKKIYSAFELVEKKWPRYRYN